MEALRISYGSYYINSSFTLAGLKNLRNLRFLECHRMDLVGEFEDVLSKLVWLQWHFCPTDFKDTKMNLENLLILELCGSKIDENWYGWSNMKVHNI